MNRSESIVKLMGALLKAQCQMGAATKSAANRFFNSNYADLNAILDAVQEPLNNNGIVLLQPHAVLPDGQALIETMLIHESGEWLSGVTKVVAKSDNNPQDAGSALTYARRYGLQSLLSIATEDDDAEKAMGRGKTIVEALPAQKQTSSDSLKDLAKSKARAVVARRLQSEQELKKQLGDEISPLQDTISNLSLGDTKSFIKHLEGKLNGK